MRVLCSGILHVKAGTCGLSIYSISLSRKELSLQSQKVGGLREILELKDNVEHVLSRDSCVHPHSLPALLSNVVHLYYINIYIHCTLCTIYKYPYLYIFEEIPSFMSHSYPKLLVEPIFN